MTRQMPSCGRDTLSIGFSPMETVSMLFICWQLLCSLSELFAVGTKEWHNNDKRCNFRNSK